jgi:hemerythrin-like metal-binding protein
VVVQHSAAVPADALGRYAPALDRLAESAGLPVAAIGLGTWPAAGSVEVLPSVETLRVWLEGVRARPARTARPAASGSAASRGAEATGWSPALAVGHGAIDTHHELLFAQIARLSQAVRDDAPAAVGRELLGFLGDYATVHFRVEEREMQRSDYPELAEYQWEHEGFLRELTRHRAAFEASDRSSAALAELARYLEGWLPRHVAGSDRRLGAHLRPSGDVDG